MHRAVLRSGDVAPIFFSLKSAGFQRYTPLSIRCSLRLEVATKTSPAKFKFQVQCALALAVFNKTDKRHVHEGQTIAKRDRLACSIIEKTNVLPVFQPGVERAWNCLKVSKAMADL